MYRRILVPLEHSAYDDAILAHVCELARLCESSVVLIHVALAATLFAWTVGLVVRVWRPAAN